MEGTVHSYQLSESGPENVGACGVVVVGVLNIIMTLKSSA